jgi:hypothetical protein
MLCAFVQIRSDIFDSSTELYQLVMATKKQVVLDLASTSLSLTDFQGRVLQQLKAMENKCRAQQKQQQLLRPKVEAVPKSEGAANQLRDSLDLEKAKVASLEYLVEELQGKNKDLDALLTERDTSISELLRQLHEGGEPRVNSLPSFSSPLGIRPPLSRASSDVDPADAQDEPPLNASRELSSQLPAPTPPPVLLPCHPPTDSELRQDLELPEESHQPQKQQSDNPQPLHADQEHSTLEQLQLSLTNKDIELKDLRHQLAQLHATLNQHNERSLQLDHLRVTQQSSLLSLEVNAKDLKLHNDKLRSSLKEKDNQHAVLVQQNAQLEQEIKELESYAHNLQMLNQHLQGQQQSLNAQNQQNQSLNTQNQNLQEQHQKLQAQHQKLQAQHGELRKICYDQDRTIADLSGTLNSLQAQAQALQAQLQQVEQRVEPQPMGTSQKLQNPQPQQSPPQPLLSPIKQDQSQPQTSQQLPPQPPSPQLEDTPQPQQAELTELPPQSQTTLLQPQKSQPSLPLDVKESTQKLDKIQQHAEEVKNRYSVDTEDVEEVQKIIRELEKIFLETFTEISRLRNILQDEGITPTPLPTCQ